MKGMNDQSCWLANAQTKAFCPFDDQMQLTDHAHECYTETAAAGVRDRLGVVTRCQGCALAHTELLALPTVGWPHI